MPNRSNQVTEGEIGKAALVVAASKIDGVATFEELKREIPDLVSLTSEDRAQSQTRPNEEMWEQKVRNLISHKATPGNIIAEGYAEPVPGEGIRITDTGRALLKI